MAAENVRKNLNQVSAAKMAMDAITKDLFSVEQSHRALNKVEDKLTTLKIISTSLMLPLEVYLTEMEQRERELKEFHVFSKIVKAETRMAQWLHEKNMMKLVEEYAALKNEIGSAEYYER